MTVHRGRAHTTPNQIKIRSKFTNWRFNIQAAERPRIDLKDTLLVTSARGELAKAIVYFKRRELCEGTRQGPWNDTEICGNLQKKKEKKRKEKRDETVIKNINNFRAILRVDLYDLYDWKFSRRSLIRV